MLIKQTQANRIARITTSLGADALLLAGFDASERLSNPFVFHADVFSETGEVDFMPLLGGDVCVEIEATEASGDLNRAFHGVLTEAERTGQASDGVRYRLTLRPWTALLATSMNARIFQKMTVIDIVAKVFDEAGFSQYDTSDISRSYKTREYCVQFRESDIDFVSRLLEEEGVYYYFRHANSGHTLVLCDTPSAHSPVAGDPTVPVLDAEARHPGARLWAWRKRVGHAAAKVTLGDQHFFTPASANRFTEAEQGDYDADTAEVYDPLGAHIKYADDATAGEEGKRFAADRLQLARAERRRFGAEGDLFVASVGAILKVEEAPGAGPLKCLLTASRHSMTCEGFRTGGEESLTFVIDFEAIPHATPWRPALNTPKPRALGPQTALVVGPAGEVIHVDKHGRVRVQFYWDRQGKSDETSSCWIRVSQGWADSSFGSMHLPRVGEEVVVDFLDGDYDRPIITGRVYNAKQAPPYALPDNKTRSVWKSRTVGESGDYGEAENPPAADAVGFNELYFEDKGGSEEINIHAQRDYNAWVRHNETRKTGQDVTVRVGRDRKTEIKNSETLIVEQGDETRTLQKGSRTTTIKANDALTVQDGNKDTTVSQGNLSDTVSMGNYSMKVSAGVATFEAAQKIELKVGGSTITLTPSGVEVKGMTVKLKGDMSLAAEGGMTTDVKAGMKMTINGAIVMIN